MAHVLLVGSGGREHAIADALSRSDDCKIYSFMSSRNPGIVRLSEEWTVGDVSDVASVVKWSSARKIEAAVIGPESPLQNGLADELSKNEVLVCGPSKTASRLEWDKSFARELMKKNKISGCPKFISTSDAREAAEFIDELDGLVAIKPAGLTGGKGVKVVGKQLKDGKEAKQYAAEVLSSNIGKLGSVVIEEKLEGEEFTLQAFVDGRGLAGMPLVQDHKLAFDGDKGPNTGGMGSYSDSNHLLPFISARECDEALAIMRETVAALSRLDSSYRGILYGQFIATAHGLKVIEFNSRFGDPEAMNVLPLLEGNFAAIAAGIGEGKLVRSEMKFVQKASVCKYLVPEGYPEKPLKGEPVDVNEAAIAREGCRVFYASIDEREGKLAMMGSRTVAVVGQGASIAEAEKKAERACTYVKGKLFHRRDIGTAELIKKRIDHMTALRSKNSG